jgi:hypothetical protein
LGPFLEQVPNNFLLPIFNQFAPIEISKHIFDLFVWEQTGMECLERVFFKCLMKMEPKALTMKSKQIACYFKSGEFLRDAFETIPLQCLFKDE